MNTTTTTTTTTTDDVVTAPAGTFVGAEVYGYCRRSAYRAVASVSGTDWEGTAHDLIVSMLTDGWDLSTMTEDIRHRVMWDAKSARRDAIRAAQVNGDEPSERAASGGVMTGRVGAVAHHLDVIGAAWDLLALRDPEAYRWAVVASYGVPKRGGLSTVHVVPFANTTDRDTRAGVIRRALDALGRAYDDVMTAARDRGVNVTTDAESVGVARHRAGTPLVDVPALSRRYGWDAETRAGAEAVTGALSPRDIAATFANHDGPAGSNTPARAPRVNTGAKGRSGALSGAPGYGTRSGSGTVAGQGRNRLASERVERETRDNVERFALSGDVTAPRPLSPEAEARAEAEAERAARLADAARSSWRPEADAARMTAERRAALRVTMSPEAEAERAARQAERDAEAERNHAARVAREAERARTAFLPYRDAARAIRREALTRG